MLVAPTAGADPLSDKKAQAARLESRIEAQGEQVSILAERYNQARLKVDRIDNSIRAANGDLGRSEERMAQVRSRMAQAAVLAYVNGGSNAMLTQLTRVNGDAVVRHQYLRITALDQQQAIGDLRAARQDLTAVRTDLESQQKTAKAALKDVDASRRAADAAQATELKLLGQVKGELSALVAAEQARRAADAIRRAKAIAARPLPGQKGQAAPNRPLPPASGRAGAAVEMAKQQVGKPYVYGGSGPDVFDCSGLVAFAWRAAGVGLSHSAQSQYSETARVPISALQPGDLLFFGSSTGSIHHDAIYVGGGTMVEASHTGIPVRYAGIGRSDLVAAGRPG